MAAKEYLLKHSLIIHNAPLTLEALRYAILHTSQVAKIPQPTQQVLRAIATLMKQIEKDTDCERYTQAIVAGVQDGLQPIINQLSSTATSLEADTQTLHSQLDDLDSSALKKIANTIETTAARVETSSATLVNTTSSYRDALLHSAKSAPTSSPLLDPQVTQRVLLQSRQVLIETGNDTTNQDSNDTIKSRAETAIKNILQSPYAARPNTTIAIEEITKIRNSSLLFQFNSKEAAAWIRSDDIRADFASALAPEALLIDRGYSVIVPFVPLTLQTDNPDHLQEILDRNRISYENSLTAKWVKPASRRNPGQMYAHCIFTLTTPSAANIAIRDGLHVHGKKVFPSKLKKEPLRCLKCHRWGHRATHCKETNDTCGTCGEHHRTSSCDNPNTHWCVSCHSNTHSSWDRQCPIFLVRCDDFDKRNPDNTLRYFPTEEAWTHFNAPPPLPREQRYPARWAQPVTQPPATTQGRRAGQKPKATATLRRQRTLDEFQAPTTARANPYSSQQTAPAMPLPPRPPTPTAGYPAFTPPRTQHPSALDWTDDNGNPNPNYD
jgi:hypothetical protein